jgi:hypothetical protein
LSKINSPVDEARKTIYYEFGVENLPFHVLQQRDSPSSFFAQTTAISANGARNPFWHHSISNGLPYL